MSFLTILLVAGALQTAPHPSMVPDVKTLTKYYDSGRDARKAHRSIMEAQGDWNKDFGENRIDQKRSRITIYTPKCLALTAGYNDEMNFIPREEGLAKYLQAAKEPPTSIEVEYDLYDWRSSRSQEPKMIDQMGFALLVDGKDPIRPSDQVVLIPLEEVSLEYTGKERVSAYDRKSHRRVSGHAYVSKESHGDHIRYQVRFPLLHESGEAFFTEKAKSVDVRAFNGKFEGGVSFGLKGI